MDWKCPACGNIYADDGSRTLTRDPHCHCQLMPYSLRVKRLELMHPEAGDCIAKLNYLEGEK